MAQTYIHTHRHTYGHGDLLTNSAQWGRVGENKSMSSFKDFCNTLVGYPVETNSALKLFPYKTVQVSVTMVWCLFPVNLGGLLGLWPALARWEVWLLHIRRTGRRDLHPLLLHNKNTGSAAPTCLPYNHRLGLLPSPHSHYLLMCPQEELYLYCILNISY